jgi:hypothetical protein
MPHGGSKRPMRWREGVGGKETMKGEDRPARAAWLYEVRSRTGQIKAARG